MNQNNKDHWKQMLQDIEIPDMKKEIMQDVEYIVPLAPLKEEKKKRTSFLKPVMVMAMAAACVLFIIMPFTRSENYDAIVALDVNPSVELVLHQEKVSEVVVNNSEGDVILGDMDLVDIDVDVAVNALIGSMFTHGYLNEDKNSLLLTVLSNDEQRRKEITDKVVQNIEAEFASHEMDAAILTQELPMDDHYASLAKEYSISEGKAALISEFIKQDTSYQFEDLMYLSINDLNILLKSRNITIEGITNIGTQSYNAYLSEDEVKHIVLQHAKCEEAAVREYTSSLDCEGKRLVYYISFKDDYAFYKYEVNAISGEMIDFAVNVK